MTNEHCPDCGSDECEGDCLDALERIENKEPTLVDGTPLSPRRKLTRNERLQALADSGCDPLEDYRGER